VRTLPASSWLLLLLQLLLLLTRYLGNAAAEQTAGLIDDERQFETTMQFSGDISTFCSALNNFTVEFSVFFIFF